MTLGCVMHPLTADALSVRIFLHQLIVAYQAGIYTVPKPLLQFSGYSSWLHQTKKSGGALASRVRRTPLAPLASTLCLTFSSLCTPPPSHLQALEYWSGVMDDSAPVLQPPTDFSRPRQPNYQRLLRHLVLNKAQNLAVNRLRVLVDERESTSDGWVRTMRDTEKHRHEY